MPQTDKPRRPLIEAVRISKHYPVKVGSFSHKLLRAVDDVSLEIFPGETLGLIGESGSGKSTLGRVLGQLLDPTSGSILFGGNEVSGITRREKHELRQKIQIIFQDPYSSLNPKMTVREIVGEPLRNFGIAKGAAADKMIREILDVCGIGESALDRYPREFSGGQRQRIGIARALILRPRFIVADEPVSALDVSIQAQIINFLRELQKTFKITFLFIGHDMAVVRHISTRIAVMYLGKIVEIADARQIYVQSRHPYTLVLLSSVPIPDPELERARRPISLVGEIPSPLSPPAGCPFHARCPWAEFPLCSTVEPTMREVGPGHRSACHFAEKLDHSGPAQRGEAPRVQVVGASTDRVKA